MPSLASRVQLGERLISSANEPYIVAEIGSNHDQSLDRALELMAVAAHSGASAAKFQFYKAGELVESTHPARSVLEATELRKDWLPTLRSYAVELGVDFLASSFSPEGASVLEHAGVAAHKVASSEALNVALLAHLSRSPLPVLLSVGMCTWADVEIALEILTSEGKRDIVLLHCTSIYPLPLDKANLRVIPEMIARYGGVTGYSDHTESHVSGAVAVGLGARVLEKHLTWSRVAEGPDHPYALEPNAFAAYCTAVRDASALLGRSDRIVEAEERTGRRRMGIYSRESIAVGEVISADNIEVRGPLSQVPARHLNSIYGLRTGRDVPANTALHWRDL